MAQGKVCWKIIREDARNSANWLQGVYLSINGLTTTTVHLWLREAYPFSSRVAERLTDLDSSQEEADTRLLSHAAHAARSRFVAIVIVSEDTDILVVCLAFKSHIQSSMFIKCSSQRTVKYLDVSRIVERIGASTCKSLPGFHTFTGCDTVSPGSHGISGTGKGTSVSDHGTKSRIPGSIPGTWKRMAAVQRVLQWLSEVHLCYVPQECGNKWSQRAAIPVLLLEEGGCWFQSPPFDLRLISQACA